MSEWKVEKENREQFEKTVWRWHLLIETIGWTDLCDMYIRRVPPFQSVEFLKGSRKHRLKQAKDILLRSMADDLKSSGLEVTP